MKFVGHARDYDIIIASLFDANSVERVAVDVCTAQGEEKYIKDRSVLSVTEKAATTTP